jgi:antitoxin component YwqK of YwqJK toxin-antitoxin module
MKTLACIMVSLLFYRDQMRNPAIGSPAYVAADIASIPADTIDTEDNMLQVVNGVCYHRCAPFSGTVREKFANGNVRSLVSYRHGTLYGRSVTYYSNGKKAQERYYSDNKCNGRHRGWWENGKPKFDFFYNMDKRDGEFCQWYRSGQPYTRLHFQNDRETGMQQAWRENGKLYLNYEAKNGFRYGLQKSMLCYTLTEEKIK